MRLVERATNGLGNMYRARGVRRFVAIAILSPFVLLAMLLSPAWILWIALTWDGR